MEIIGDRLGGEVYPVNKKLMMVYPLQLVNKYSVKKKKRTNKQTIIAIKKIY